MTPQHLITLAREKGLSINEVQRRAKTGNTFFWRWRHDKIKPRQSTIDRIIAVLEDAE